MPLLSKLWDSCLTLALLMVGELVQPCLTPFFGMSWEWECDAWWKQLHQFLHGGS